jgi:hypothetical protein
LTPFQGVVTDSPGEEVGRVVGHQAVVFMLDLAEVFVGELNNWRI